MQEPDVLLICGTRPEIIKMAPVYAALQASTKLRPRLLHSGQHTDLAWPLYEFFGMTVDYSIELTRSNSSLAHLSALLLEQTTQVLQAARPAAVLVHGDTSTAAMGALAAFYEQIPVGHVEAGLRTGDKYSPFPEEMNRSLIGRMADWHFAPTALAEQALRAEGLGAKAGSLVVTGNTVIDAALAARYRTAEHAPAVVAQYGLSERLENKRLALVTAHRRENWGAGLESIAHATADMLEQYPDMVAVWPLHANPQVAKTVREALAPRNVDETRLVLTPPLDYADLIWLLSHAWVTLTDSGGIQEEAAALGVPVLVLRESTERPELITAGGGVLVGTDRSRIGKTLADLTQSLARYTAMRHIQNPFGDGTAGVQIVRHLEQALQA